MKMDKNFEKMSQDAANISKEAMEACQKSASVWTNCGQQYMEAYMKIMQQTAEKQSKLMQEMMSKKTVNEMSEAMQSASQESFNDMMANISKLSEQSIKAAMESLEPINHQMNKTMKNASQMAA